MDGSSSAFETGAKRRLPRGLPSGRPWMAGQGDPEPIRRAMDGSGELDRSLCQATYTLFTLASQELNIAPRSQTIGCRFRVNILFSGRTPQRNPHA